MIRPAGHTSVMQQRHAAPPDELDFFPTPPWATRAFLQVLLAFDGGLGGSDVWEPACGSGHMVGPLDEVFALVLASDVFVHPWLAPAEHHPLPFRLDFLDSSATARPHWVITNPPFKTAVEFALKGLQLARRGVALLVRTSWLEGADRFERLFRPHPPAVVVQYVERVAMTRGRWEPDASTATSYCWVVWLKDRETGPTQFRWIPPGAKKRFSRPEDLVFAVQADAPMLDASAGRQGGAS